MDTFAQHDPPTPILSLRAERYCGSPSRLVLAPSPCTRPCLLSRYLSPKPRVIWRRTKDCSLQQRALPFQQSAARLPLRPALLNGYKLEDKSTGFQAILPSISGNCRSRSCCVGTEEERRKTQSLLGPRLQQTNRRRGPSTVPASRSHSPSLEETKLCWGSVTQMLFTEHLLCTGAREVGCQQSSTDVGPEPEVTDKGPLG